MKRCTITTLTIALISLVIMLIATHVAQSMAKKEGLGTAAAFDPDDLSGLSSKEIPHGKGGNTYEIPDHAGTSRIDGPGTGGPGVGGPSTGGPGGRRPIVINVNNTGGSYAPQGTMGQAMGQSMPSRTIQITHELSDETDQHLEKSMNFMEFVMKKSQN